MTFLSEGERAKNKNRDWFHFWTQYTDNDDTWKKTSNKVMAQHTEIMLGRSISQVIGFQKNHKLMLGHEFGLFATLNKQTLH